MLCGLFAHLFMIIEVTGHICDMDVVPRRVIYFCTYISWVVILKTVELNKSNVRFKVRRGFGNSYTEEHGRTTFLKYHTLFVI